MIASPGLVFASLLLVLASACAPVVGLDSDAGAGSGTVAPGEVRPHAEPGYVDACEQLDGG